MYINKSQIQLNRMISKIGNATRTQWFDQDVQCTQNDLKITDPKSMLYFQFQLCAQRLGAPAVFRHTQSRTIHKLLSVNQDNSQIIFYEQDNSQIILHELGQCLLHFPSTRTIHTSFLMNQDNILFVGQYTIRRIYNLFSTDQNIFVFFVNPLSSLTMTTKPRLGSTSY